MTVEIRALRADDDRQTFRSDDEALDLYFHRYAGQNQFRHHIGVSYVAVEAERILGFATVTPATLDAELLPSGRKMPPYPMPVLRVARLAVDTSSRKRGIGRALVRFCIELAERLRGDVGCVGLLVDAKPEAEQFLLGGSAPRLALRARTPPGFGARLRERQFYSLLGFVPVSLVEGDAPIIPATVPMYLPLGAVPRRRASPE